MKLPKFVPLDPNDIALYLQWAVKDFRKENSHGRIILFDVGPRPEIEVERWIPDAAIAVPFDYFVWRALDVAMTPVSEDEDNRCDENTDVTESFEVPADPPEDLTPEDRISDVFYGLERARLPSRWSSKPGFGTILKPGTTIKDSGHSIPQPGVYFFSGRESVERMLIAAARGLVESDAWNDPVWRPGSAPAK